MRVVLSIQAEQDLSDLFDIIASDSGIDRADAILTRIGQTIDNLAQTPGIGRVRPDLDGAPRAFTIWPWIVFYEPRSNGDGIVVWRVIDGRRDLPDVVRRPRH